MNHRVILKMKQTFPEEVKILHVPESEYTSIDTFQRLGVEIKEE